MPVSLKKRMLHRLIILILVMSLISGCAAPAAEVTATAKEIAAEAPAAAVFDGQTLEPTAASTITRAGKTELHLPQASSQRSTPAAGQGMETPAPYKARLWVLPALPQRLRAQLRIPPGLETTKQSGLANMRIEIPAIQHYSNKARDPETVTAWIYAVVAPFPTVSDAVDLEAIQAAWRGKPGPAFDGNPLLMSAETRAVLEAYWGAASEKGIQVIADDALLDTAWREQPAWAVIPFEDIVPRWKVLRVDGQSPLDRDFDPDRYPLAVPVWVSVTDEIRAANPSIPLLPTNRDPQKLTVLVISGVTALSRHIAERMETKGITYPARDIRSWLVDADLTHISNEVSFYPDCPRPGPERADMRFCSHPKYIELLEYAGVDIIELTGNHNLDWGRQPYLDTLEMYRQRGWGTYGGGANLAEAQTPLLVEHNGNQIAFLGCSPAGPEKVWATTSTPGSAPCNFSRLEEQVRALRAEGKLPVVTLQAFETDTYLPTPAQGMLNYRRLAAAGAVVVSGSQSHVPQTMTFVNNSFVHYGLGNLFFDQMQPPEARQQFIDRHIFYNGQYLGVELLSALLEDFSRPRPMQAAERETFLKTVFALSDWSGK